MTVAFVVLGPATIQLVAFWHMRNGSIDWHQWFCDVKQGWFFRAICVTTSAGGWYWASKLMGVDASESSQNLMSAVSQPDQDLGVCVGAACWSSTVPMHSK